MSKKMNLSEKRKLERRLPLWESSYPLALPSEKVELLKKIENARSILGMDSFIKSKSKKTEQEQIKFITNNKINEIENKRKREPDIVELKSYLDGKGGLMCECDIPGVKIDPEVIMVLKNEYKLRDIDIYRLYKSCEKTLVNIKNKYLEKIAIPKSDVEHSKNKILNFTPEYFLELKQSGITNAEIARQYGTSTQSVCYFEKKYLKRIYKTVNLQEIRKESNINIVNEICKQLNEGKKITEMNVLGKNEAQRFRLKYRYIECDYELKDIKKLNVESYCYYHNSGLKDYEIAKIYGIDKSTVKNFKKKFIKVEYFLK